MTLSDQTVRYIRKCIVYYIKYNNLDFNFSTFHDVKPVVVAKILHEAF